jgi:hypothetical protein
VRRCWPTREASQKVRPSARETVFHAHHSVRNETLAHRMAAIQAAVPCTTDQAVRHASVRMLNAFTTHMQTPIEASHAVDHAIAQRWSTP